MLKTSLKAEKLGPNTLSNKIMYKYDCLLDVTLSL